jgi:RNA polymerase sigma factor (sigma-70 family)
VLRLLTSQPLGPESEDDFSSESRAVADPLRTLATRAARREPAAEQTLLAAVGPAMLRVVRRILGTRHPEVQDVCQEAAVALLSALPRFAGQCSVLHFACRVAVLTAMNARRRASHRGTPMGLDLAQDAADDGLSPAEMAEAARRRAVLRQLLDELPWPQAEALSLHVVLGYTVVETASAVGAAPNTVRSRLRRALAALRGRINSDSNLLEVIGARHE